MSGIRETGSRVILTTPKTIVMNNTAVTEIGLCINLFNIL